MQHVRKVPQRSCVGCQQAFSKRELLRVVRTPDGAVVLDPTGKRAGRGAYICPRTECFDRAVKGRRLQRALEVEIPEDILAQLKNALSDLEQ